MERAGNAAILPADPLITDHWSPFSRRGGRSVDCAGLENRKAERPREFESHPLRHLLFHFRLPSLGFAKKEVSHDERPKNAECRRAYNVGQIMRADIHAGDTD